ncbi:MAG TPA: 3D domain-containing protein [Chthoniobacterales bacterium]|nr:3D domain-containing protein [Chthoniobacterales bacterium]
MANFLRLTGLVFAASLLVSCATSPNTSATAKVAPDRFRKVRTTAYTHNEGSGSKNAIGRRLSGAGIKSAASDWSRYPLGTRFRIAGTNDEYVIDDYGGALVGTNTIDLYKPSMLEMRRWGVRHVDIEVLRWGSENESLRVLRPRKSTRLARRMIASLESKKSL